MNAGILSILQSPDDGTPLSADLVSQSGIKYQISDAGVLLLDREQGKRLDVVYDHPMMVKWEGILQERLQYYTKKRTLAGRLAHLSYRSLRRFSDAKLDEFIVDIGCGDGSQASRLKHQRNYIGVDRNLKRLEILKARFPDATAIYCDASHLPFRTGSIRYIFSSNAFEHLWYLKEVVYDCFRCLAQNGEATIVFPTEGGLWNLGRRFLSKPFFSKRHPDIDFELISHLEHCNNATQIVRTLETFFAVDVRYLPTRIPTIFLNALVEARCRQHPELSRQFERRAA